MWICCHRAAEGPTCRDRHEASLLKAFAAAAAATGLAPHEVPTAVAILSEKWSAKDGTLTPSNKVDRAGITSRFGRDLQRIGAGGGMAGADTSGKGPAAKHALDARVVRFLSTKAEDAAAAVFRREIFADGAAAEDLTIVELGGDSIVAARVKGAFPSKLTIDQIVSLPLGHLRKLVQGTAVGSVGPSADFWASEVSRSQQALAPPTDRRSRQAADGDDATVVLVTGVTGFVGPHLLAALGRQGRWSKIIALVRPPLSRVGALSSGLQPDLELIAADVGAPGLGLTAADRDRLANTVIDTVVHSAAHVDHMQSYQQLYRTNVAACDELVAVLASSHPTFVFVSSVSAAAPNSAEDLESTPADAVTALGGGYGKTKWVAERRLAATAHTGALRSLRIVRLGLIGPHSTTGEANFNDWLHLFLRAAAAAKAAPEMLADASIEMLPVDAAAATLASLAAADAASTTDPACAAVRINHVDARAAGILACSVTQLLSAAVAGLGPGGGDGRAPTVLPYAAWCGRVRSIGGPAEKVLALLPAPDTVERPGLFMMPSASREDLQRGTEVRTVLATALPGLEAGCYKTAMFQKGWTTRFAGLLGAAPEPRG
eukprot:SAG22_NODE_337_length_12043_cov_58.339556_11_plen_603_part_00